MPRDQDRTWTALVVPQESERESQCTQSPLQLH
ncbi:hypothetical protein J2Z21_003010 [Streptomyces griseochromogenes]|uniref:Uncharacterized protein n=1 Tax=Streptomyces griseochromogenes TaxID=68214 RepID=A0ABS4LS35_9ACTN|nr:hypothetical protein [Streptomyces griseochromogenes]